MIIPDADRVTIEFTKDERRQVLQAVMTARDNGMVTRVPLEMTLEIAADDTVMMMALGRMAEELQRAVNENRRNVRALRNIQPVGVDGDNARYYELGNIDDILRGEARGVVQWADGDLNGEWVVASPGHIHAFAYPKEDESNWLFKSEDIKNG